MKKTQKKPTWKPVSGVGKKGSKKVAGQVDGDFGPLSTAKKKTPVREQAVVADNGFSPDPENSPFDGS